MLRGCESSPFLLTSTVGLDMPSTRNNSGSVSNGRSDTWLSSTVCSTLGNNWWCAWRFPNVSISTEATVNRARIVVNLTKTAFTSTACVFQMEDSDSSAPFPTEAYDFTTRNRTRGIIASPSNLGLGVQELVVELASEVSAVIKRPGWKYGNAMTIFVGYSSGICAFSSCAVSMTMNMRLVINYTLSSTIDRVSTGNLQPLGGAWNTTEDGRLLAVAYYNNLVLGSPSQFRVTGAFPHLSVQLSTTNYFVSRNDRRLGAILCSPYSQSFRYSLNSNFTVSCTLSLQLGKNWSLQTVFCWDLLNGTYRAPPMNALISWTGERCFTVTEGSFDFPSPMLLNSTLVPYGRAFSSEAGTLTSNTTSVALNDRFSQILVIGARNIIPRFANITLKAVNSSWGTPCQFNVVPLTNVTPVAALRDISYTPVACALQSCSEMDCPSLYEYQLYISYGLDTFVSYDTLTYPSLPIIVSISGCQDEGNGTVCPASGGGRIFVHLKGEVFTDSISVLVGVASACTSVRRESEKVISCTLPSGTGIGVVTVVVVSGYTSLPAFFLSYAPPRIDDIIGGPGCNRSFVNDPSLGSMIVLEDCDRLGSTNTSLLTMTGANFGTGNVLSLLLGSVSLVYERNNDSIVYFYLAPGFGSRELIVSVNGLSANTAQSTKALIGYVPCAEGMDSYCVACPVGRFGGRVHGFDTCSPCLAGQYQPKIGQTACLFCARGFFQPSTGSFECLNCPVSMTTAGVGNSLLSACYSCSTNSYLNKSGADLACAECPANSIPSIGSKGCICRQGFYDVTNYDADAGAFNPNLLRCVACPLGADCSVAGSTDASLMPVEGWWRSNKGSFYTCLKASNCPAAVTVGSNHTSVCAQHRSGVLCSTCDEGFQDTASGGACTSCDDSSAFLWLSIVLVLLAVALTGFAFWYQRRKLELMAKQQSQSTKQLDDARKHESIPLMPSAKLVVGFLQVVTSVVSSFLALPSIFVSVMSVFAFINFDFVPWASIHCLFGIDFYTKIYIACTYPVGVLSLLVLCVVVPIAFINKTDYEDENTARLKRRRHLNQAWTLLLFCLFLLYPWITLQLLQFGICVRVENEYFLVADFRQKCLQGEWMDQLGPVIFLFLLIPVGVPLTFGVILWRSRTSLRTPATRERLGFLYSSYSATAWWFELFDMAYKVALISVVRFFDREIQAPIRMGVCLVYIVTVLIHNPFLYTTWDFLSLLCAVEVLLLSLLAHVLPAEGAWQGSYIDVLLSLILLFLVFLVVVYFCSLVVRASRALMRHPKLRKLLAPKPVTRLRMATQFRGRLPTLMDSTLSFDTDSVQEFPAGDNSSSDSVAQFSSSSRRALNTSVSGNLKPHLSHDSHGDPPHDTL